MSNLHDDLCGYVERQGARGATPGEACRALGGDLSRIAGAWVVLAHAGRLVHTGQYRQVDERTERVFVTGRVDPVEPDERYSANQPRDKHGRWTTGGGGGAGGSGSGGKLDTGGAESLIKSIHDSGGFTFDPRTGGLINVGDVKGVAVAVPHTEQIVGYGENVSRAEFVRGVTDVIEKHGDALGKGAFLGGWYSPERKAYMVELTELVPDRQAAIKLGKERNQEGVFDLGTGEYIPTGGTGG